MRILLPSLCWLSLVGTPAVADHGEPHGPAAEKPVKQAYEHAQATADEVQDAFQAGKVIKQPSTTTSADGSGPIASTEVSVSAAVRPPTLIPHCEQGGTALDFPNGFGCKGAQVTCGEDGLVFTVVTYDATGKETNHGAQCLEPEEVPQGTPLNIPGEVLEQFKNIKLTPLPLEVQPPGGETLVNLPTIFSTQDQDFTRDVALPKVRTTIELHIWTDSFTWHFGDGTTRTTDHPGDRWSQGKDVASLLTHVYTAVEKGIPVSVDTTYAAEWRVKGDPKWEPVNGTVTVESDEEVLDVLEAKPLLVKQ